MQKYKMTLQSLFCCLPSSTTKNQMWLKLLLSTHQQTKTESAWSSLVFNAKETTVLSPTRIRRGSRVEAKSFKRRGLFQQLSMSSWRASALTIANHCILRDFARSTADFTWLSTGTNMCLGSRSFASFRLTKGTLKDQMESSCPTTWSL